MEGGANKATEPIKSQNNRAPRIGNTVVDISKDLGDKIWGPKAPNMDKIDFFPFRAICHTVTMARN